MAEAPAPVMQPAPVAPHHPITLSADALFDFNKAVLKPEGKKLIDRELQKATSQSDLSSIKKVKIAGYTDSIGSAKYNLKLSEKRADAVKSYLVSKGIPASRIHTEGHGLNDPVASNKTREGRAQNRRAEIWFDQQ
ncbi:MAG: OmpA family protein [Ferrovum sp.]|nr:OmpA family protein [Ferrovum sp.]